MRKPVRIEPPDVYLLGVTLTLVAIGVLLVFDASYARGGDLRAYGYDTLYFAKRQLAYAGIGLVCMLMASVVPVEFLRKMSIVLLGLAFALLILVLVPGIGHKVNGARSWFKLGPISFQPSELAKLILVLYLARALARPRIFAKRAEKKWTGALWIAGGVIALVIAEKDLGTAVVFSSIVFMMFAAAGAKKRWMIPAAACGLLAVYGLMCLVPHCKPRLEAYKDPWAHRYEKGYQIVHSLIGFGTGGWWGVGPCEGRVKSYIPAASTDYIYATVGEETGVAGSALLLLMFAFFSFRGLKVARKCGNPYGSLVATGITSAVSVQALVNMAVATNSIPATGLPLPFISYGGSSLVIVLIGAGLLLTVSRQSHVELEEQDAHAGSSHRGRDGRAHISGYQRGTGASGGGSHGRAAVHG